MQKRLILLSVFITLFSSISFAAKIVTPQLKDMKFPDGKPPTPLQVQLGKQLFFEPLLSRSTSMSCATCHDPNLGFGDARQFSLGDNGKPLVRHTPHLYNIGFATSLFWDGRVTTLEAQALMPIISETEMNLPLNEMLERLGRVTYYKRTFEEAYGELNAQTVAKALAAFQRTLITNESPFDRFLAGDQRAISEDAKKGWSLYNGKANCFSCHSGPDLSHNQFENIGMGVKDVGRQPFAAPSELTNNRSALGKFKSPGLRNIALTAPYMHDGSIASLEEVIRFYMRGGDSDENKSTQISEINLTEAEVRQLLAFLGSLTDAIKVDIPPPAY